MAAEKLPYPAREAVRRQTSNLDKAQKTLAVLKKQAEWRAYPNAVEPGLGLTPLLDSIENDLTKNNTPKDHPDAAKLYDGVAAIRAALPALEATLKEKHAKWKEFADVNNYPHFQRDLETFAELYQTYKAAGEAAKRAGGALPKGGGPIPRYAQPMHGIENFAEAANRYEENADYFNNAIKRYDLLMKTNPGAKNRILSQAKPVVKYMTEFNEVKDAAVASFPEHIRHNLAVAKDMATMASNDRKPGFFTGGVPQAMDAANIVLKAYTGIKGKDDATVAALSSERDAVKQELDAAEVALAELILQEARLAGDKYTGNDRDAILQQARDAYSKAFPKDEIMHVRIPMETWERNATWKRNAVEWYLVDSSHVLAQVVVKRSDSVAEAMPVLLVKNHQKQDRLSIGAHDNGYGSRKVLIANIK